MKRSLWCLGVLVCFGYGTLSHASSGESVPSSGLEKQGESAPWSGTSVSIGNSYNVDGLAKSTTLDWRPKYRLRLGLSPVWALSEAVTLSGRWGFSGSFFEHGKLSSEAAGVPLSEGPSSEGSDGSHQTFSSGDLSMNVSFANLVSVPWVEVPVSFDASVVLPTSDYSFNANPLYLGLGGDVSFHRGVKVLNGLRLSYTLGVNKTFYESYDGSKARASSATSGRNCFSLLEDDVSGLTRCLSHDGQRNPVLGISNGFRFSLKVLDGVSVSGAFNLGHSFLGDLPASEVLEEVSYQSQETSTVRYIMVETLGVNFTKIPLAPYLGVQLGLNGVHGTRGRDAQYLHVLDGDYLHYLRVYLNLQLDIESLVGQLRGSGKA